MKPTVQHTHVTCYNEILRDANCWLCNMTQPAGPNWQCGFSAANSHAIKSFKRPLQQVPRARVACRDEMSSVLRPHSFPCVAITLCVHAPDNFPIF